MAYMTRDPGSHITAYSKLSGIIQCDAPVLWDMTVVKWSKSFQRLD